MLPDYKWLPFKYPRHMHVVNTSEVHGFLLFSICIFIWPTIGLNTNWYQRLNKDYQQLNKTSLCPMWYSLHSQIFLVKAVEYSAGEDEQKWTCTDCLMLHFKNVGATLPILFLWGQTNSTLWVVPGNNTKSQFWRLSCGSVLCYVHVT